MDDALRRRRGKLILADGTRFDGFLIGAGRLPVWGEVVFNTSMTGYQEVITDPSYAGQLVVMTYPHIGNYGITTCDSEGRACAARGLVVREISPFFSPAPGRCSLESFMKDVGLRGLTGIDTRALTRRIRSGGAAIGVIAERELPDEELVGLARNRAYSKDEALVYSVTGTLRAGQAAHVSANSHEGMSRTGRGLKDPLATPRGVIPRPGACPSNEQALPYENAGSRLALIDLGIKKSIIERIAALGVETAILDARFDPRHIFSGRFDGLVISNGPGDPADVPEVIRKVETLLGRIPILGICLGHQITALAMGGKTYKMKFGHRGANQPVVCRESRRVYITSQNHGYAVSDDLERSTGAEITFVNANDGTVEGFTDTRRGIECVQFHPEASPGPQDTVFLFERFLQRVIGSQRASAA